jgi:hypothetical protein
MLLLSLMKISHESCNTQMLYGLSFISGCSEVERSKTVTVLLIFLCYSSVYIYIYTIWDYHTILDRRGNESSRV